MSLNVSLLQLIVSFNLGCGGVEIHHSPQIVRRINGVFTASARTSWCSGCVWVLVWIEPAKILQIIFRIYLGIVDRFVHAALDGAEGKLQEIGCRVWSSNLVLHAQTAPGPKPMAQAACNDFNKGCIDTGRVYQPGLRSTSR
jgi:hypothetical protein